MRRVYLDNNATTPVLPEVLAAMQPYFGEHFGNASSIHRYGQETRAAVEAEGGCLVLERAPVELKINCDAWGAISPEILAIMKRIKTEFDPLDCLSPGRFVGGL